MAIEKILHPTDFSPQARTALIYAAELSGRLQVPLLLMTAFQLPVYPLPPEGVVLPTAETAHHLLEQANHHIASEQRTAVELGAHAVETLVVEGAAAPEIVRVANERGIDLIVMGSHGRGVLARAILGSVADRVTRMAHCPVMIVAHAELTDGTPT